MKTFKNCFKILLGSFQNHAINTNFTATAIDFRLRGVCDMHTVPTELSNLERTRVIKNASVAFRKSLILLLWDAVRQILIPLGRFIIA